MDWGRVEIHWDQYRDQVRAKFDRLTQADLNEIHGRRDALVAKIAERYGISRDQAQGQLLDLESALTEPDTTLENERKTAAESAVIGNTVKP